MESFASLLIDFGYAHCKVSSDRNEIISSVCKLLEVHEDDPVVAAAVAYLRDVPNAYDNLSGDSFIHTHADLSQQFANIAIGEAAHPLRDVSIETECGDVRMVTVTTPISAEAFYYIREDFRSRKDAIMSLTVRLIGNVSDFAWSNAYAAIPFLEPNSCTYIEDVYICAPQYTLSADTVKSGLGSMISLRDVFILSDY